MIFYREDPSITITPPLSCPLILQTAKSLFDLSR